VGQTPLSVGGLVAGDHRVRVVKDGYLENARVVAVTGKRQDLRVQLTRRPAASLESERQVSSTGGGGGGSKKWLWVGLAGAGAAVAAVVLNNRNQPPVPGTITVSPTGTGMAGVTSFNISSVGASDPDGDTLTKTWNLSDGGSGTGDSITHTFNSQGSATVNLTIDDGHNHTVSPAAASVLVGPAVAGTWTGGTIFLQGTSGSTQSCGVTLSLGQNGTALSGSVALTGACSTQTTSLTSSSASGVTHPTNITLQTNPFSSIIGGTPYTNLVLRFSGSTSTTGTTMSGAITLAQPSSSFSGSNTTTFTRQ